MGDLRNTDYDTRTAVAVSNIYVNVPPEAKYFYNDNDSAGAQLDGQNLYAITFAKGQLPPVNGFWSLTLYNDQHMFIPTHSTPSRSARRTRRCNTTPMARSRSMRAPRLPVRIRKPTGCRHLRDVLALLRPYWGEKATLDGTWTPPTIEKVK